MENTIFMIFAAIIAAPFAVVLAYNSVKVLGMMLLVLYADALGLLGFENLRNYLDHNL